MSFKPSRALIVSGAVVLSISIGAEQILSDRRGDTLASRHFHTHSETSEALVITTTSPYAISGNVSVRIEHIRLAGDLR